MPEAKPNNHVKRYATAAIIIGGGAVLGSSALLSSRSQNYGLPFTHNGQRYYIPSDSKRVVYPSREACMKEVPAHMQKECEPMSNYRPGLNSWYGPVYSSRSASGAGYQPGGQYPIENATSSNVGKQLPSGANSSGFGANGKAFTGTKGG